MNYPMRGKVLGHNRCAVRGRALRLHRMGTERRPELDGGIAERGRADRSRTPDVCALPDWP